MKNCFYSLLAAAFVFVFAPRAEATCINPTSSPTHRLVPPPALAAQQRAVGADASDNNSIVGFWATTFYVADTSDIWDEAFELWHADGTEIALDNGVPPVLGNVCVGAWQQTGRTIRLLHYAWNWNPDGSKAGVFQLQMTITLDKGGHTFAGTYVADSFDTGGQVIPELHAEGVVRGSRITVD